MNIFHRFLIWLWDHTLGRDEVYQRDRENHGWGPQAKP
jgi:hypothetical protein